MKLVFILLSLLILCSCSATCPKCPTMKAAVVLACPDTKGDMTETPRELTLTVGEVEEDTIGIWTILGGVLGGVLTFLVS